jgi:hypothetical protein
MFKIACTTVMVSLMPFLQCLGPDDDVACTMMYVYGVSAEATNAQTGATITNATLTLRDGNYIEVMQSITPGEFFGAGERPGTYSLTAQASGFQGVTVENIVVKSDPCHVIPVTVQVAMQPQP